LSSRWIWRGFAPAFLVVPALLTTACTSLTQGGSVRIRAVATVTQVSALTRAVGGDRIQLTALLKSTDDPHAYEPHPSDVTALAQAKLIVKSGAGLDKWIDKPITAAAPNATVVDASASARLRSSATEGQDPHWWYDVDNARSASDAIANALAGVDPANAASYRASASELKRRLHDADRQIHALVDPIPAAQRLFVANHDAFNYFLARYQITLVGDIIPSTDSLAAVRPADTAKLINDVRQKRVKAIFTETTLQSGLASQIATATGVKVFDGKLYGDAIGDPGTDGATLEGALVHNGRLMAAAFTS
jgi:ABC-type Zn uptake system ZnuABC Zn-binding protein ZnuA